MFFLYFLLKSIAQHPPLIEVSYSIQTVYFLIFIWLPADTVAGTAAEMMLFFARLTAGVLKPNSHQFVAPNV